MTPYRLEVGKSCEIGNEETHSVTNSGTEHRINFIFDDFLPQSISGREPGVSPR